MIITSEEPSADTRDMYAVHTLFRREFALMPGLVRGLAAGDKQRVQIVADHIELMNTILHHHHAAEDKHLWHKLLDRASGDVVPIVQRMAGHHESLETMVTSVDEATKSLRTTASSTSAEVLAQLLDRMIVPLNEHMTEEEAHILPIVEKHVTAAEWDRMVQEAAEETPREHLPLIFGMVMYEGEPDVIRQILSQMPAEVRPIIQEQAARLFASYAQRVHGTANPPRVTRSAASGSSAA